ncbi:MAG: hypothetical protein WBH05_17920, partial [Syntrophobacteria bacterium]
KSRRRGCGVSERTTINGINTLHFEDSLSRFSPAKAGQGASIVYQYGYLLMQHEERNFEA